MKLPSFAKGHKICIGPSKLSPVTGCLLSAKLNREHGGQHQEVKPCISPCQMHYYNTGSDIQNTSPTETSHTSETFQCGGWKLALGGEII